VLAVDLRGEGRKSKAAEHARSTTAMVKSVRVRPRTYNSKSIAAGRRSHNIHNIHKAKRPAITAGRSISMQLRNDQIE
jgi:hypothetical protein